MARHNNLGVALMDQGEYAEAAKEFRAALQENGEDITARVNLGMALYYDGKHAAAQQELEAALRLQPDHPPAHYVLGLLAYYTTAQHAQAAQHFAAVAHADPDDAWTHYYLGLSLMRLSRFEEAATALRRAVHLDPGLLAARYHLSLALRRTGKTEEANKEMATFTQVRTVARGQSATPGVGYLEQGKYAEAVAGTKLPISDFRFPISDFRDAQSAIRNPQSAIRNAMGDYDNDGIEDTLKVEEGKVTLYRRDRQGQETDVTARAGVRLTPQAHPTAAALADIDHDGDLDIYVCCDGQPNLLFRNTSAGRFVDVARQAQVDGGNGRSVGVVFADFNNDRGVDFCVANADAPPFLFLNNRDGTFSERAAAWGLTKQASSRVATGDVNHDGYPDLFLAPGPDGPAALFLNDRGRAFKPLANLPDLAKLKGPVAACGFLDVDSDGDLDLLCLTSAAQPQTDSLRVFRNDFIRSSSRNWLRVQLHGRIKPQVLSNYSGIGAKVEIRAAGLWLKREVQAHTSHLSTEGNTLLFGLGDVPQLDYVRVIFPSGVRLTKHNVPANQTLVMDEPAGKYTSCPMVYTWNGARFEFIADVMGGGVIGEWEAPDKWLHPDPDEWLKIDGGHLTPKDGAYLIQFVNQLEEVDMVDTVQLVAVDHPADVEIFPDERLLSSPPTTDCGLRNADCGFGNQKSQIPNPKSQIPLRQYAVHNARPPLSATDDHGHNVLPLLAKRDGRYHDDFELLPWRGFAKPHSLTLRLRIADCGLRIEKQSPTQNPKSKIQNLQPVLLLHGWTDWGSSSSILAAWQAGTTLLPMKLEVINARGEWQTAIADIGIPAGTPRTIVVPLRGLFPTDDHRLRITTNMTVYWDEIRVGWATDAPVTTHDLPLISADLHWFGYPQAVAPPSSPPIYDYHQRRASEEWGTHAGAYTRFGEVRELLLRRDDQFVVIGHGEEITLRFDARRLPPLPRGWQRDFLLYTDGYGKDMDVNSAYPFTVGPLPFHAMTSYPFARGEGYPLDETHLEYLFRWNTRMVGRVGVGAVEP
jgi:Tfp pilus assembly protein PilF